MSHTKTNMGFQELAAYHLSNAYRILDNLIREVERTPFSGTLLYILTGIRSELKRFLDIELMRRGKK